MNRDYKQKYEKLLNERDSILQAVYNEMMYNQPIRYSLRSKLLKHCNERSIEIPEQLK